MLSCGAEQDSLSHIQHGIPRKAEQTSNYTRVSITTIRKRNMSHFREFDLRFLAVCCIIQLTKLVYAKVLFEASNPVAKMHFCKHMKGLYSRWKQRIR